MDNQSHTIKLYALQSEEVVNVIETAGVCYVKKEFIKKKYGEVAHVFLGAYEWYAAAASKIVPRPEEGESAFWTHLDPKMIERHPGSYFLELDVPEDQAVYFRGKDWSRILNYRYLGDSKEAQDAFEEKLTLHGVAHWPDVFFTSFYPLFKKELVDSWQALFRYDSLIKSGELPAHEIMDMQCGLWAIQKEWISSKSLVR